MRTIMHGTSFIAMTAMERAKGRYMRAPDHPTGGEGGEGGDGGESDGDGTVVDDETSGQEVNDDLETGDGQPPAGDDSQPEGGEEGGEEPPKPEDAGGVEARLTALEAKNKEQEQDIAYWMGRANGTLNEDGTPVKPEGGESPEIPADDPDRPKPEDYQYGATDENYIRDLARYESNLAYEERRAQDEVKHQMQEVETAHTARVEKVRERLPDYDELVVKGADADPATGHAKWSCSPLMTLGIKTSEYGPDVAYHLAKNPEESRRIAQMSPIEQAKQFGRLERDAELAAIARGDVGGEEPATRHSNAPNPPPRARGAGSGGQPSLNSDSFEDFEQAADAHLKKSKKRR